MMAGRINLRTVVSALLCSLLRRCCAQCDFNGISTEDFNDCHLILDGDNITYKVLEGGKGLSIISHTLEIDPNCVETNEARKNQCVELHAAVSGSVTCSELSFLFVDDSVGSCRRMLSCHSDLLNQSDNETVCVITCPKRTNKNGTYEVHLMFGLFPETYELRELGFPPDVWCLPSNWSAGDRPVIYRSFDQLNGFVLRKGSQKTSGKVNYAVMTDRTLEQYVDLGNLSAACMTRPETCDNGGTVTLWVKLLEVGGFQGIITSLDIPRSDGFTFYLSDSILGCDAVLSNGYYTALKYSVNIDTWFHISFVYRGSTDGVYLYFDGSFINSNGWTALQTSSGSRVVEIGTLYTNPRQDYGSVIVDELTMWNRQLTSDEITQIYQN